MADVQPLHTLRYESAAAGPLEDVIAPPYDVIDDELRAELVGRSKHNVVEIDLPRANGGDPYEHAAETMSSWRSDGVLVREDEPAIWVLRQEYTGPDGRDLVRTGFLARVRVEDYGAGRIRPHERTHPGPKEDRLRLTRATRTNLSPIFSLFPDPDAEASRTLEAGMRGEPFATATDHEGTRNTLWRLSEPDWVATLQGAVADAELLIADGHHRYETARVYADEVGGEGEHRYVLMLLCSLSDPGLTVFPTHRLLTGLKDDPDKQQAIREVLTRDFDVEELGSPEELEAPAGDRVAFGYMDSFHKKPLPRDPDGSGDRRPRARRHARPLPEARHRGARGAGAEGGARDVRGRHLPPPRAQLFEEPGGRHRRRAVRPRRRRVLHASDPRGAGSGGGRGGRVHASQVHEFLPQGAHRPGLQPAGVGRLGDGGSPLRP